MSYFKVLAGCALLAVGIEAASLDQLKVQISVGRAAANAAPVYVRLVPSGGVELRNSAGQAFDGLWQSTAGGGQAQDLAFTLAYPRRQVTPIQNLQVIWADLIAHSDPDTVRRLTQDPAWRPDPRKLTVEMDSTGTKGFTLTLDQLLNTGTFWIPSLDVYLSSGESPVPFAEHQQELERWRGARILEQLQRDPESTYEQYKALWQDMGSPDYIHPNQPAPGHIVGLTWDSAIPKFGIDRGAGVWNDYGNPDHFRFWFEFSNLTEGIGPYWKGQSLADGLPVMTTALERDGVRYEVEQFAYPLNGPPPQRTGDLKMLLLARVRLTDLRGRARTVPVTMTHERQFPPEADLDVIARDERGRLLFLDNGHHNVLLSVEAPGAKIVWAGVEDAQGMKRIDVTVPVELPAHGSREFFVTLPSPVVEPGDVRTLLDLNYNTARAGTLKFWSDYVARGAQFNVPEKAVNDLFRATLWHALRLPRRHADGSMDLPYSNFAYGQFGTPWPVNQAVYVDYMLYTLRGYPAIASEELAAIYHNNQEVSGHVNGWAHWLAYTPGMLYAVAQNYLLTGDRESFEKLLPATLRALDWSLEQVRDAAATPGPFEGLVAGPLNDLTGRGYWAFNQAYLYAGLDLFGKALQRAGHPRAEECLDTARAFRAAVERGFRMASVRSPLVELRDHTWIPYVPCEATKDGRIFEQWYPTDVDTGAVHLLRLKAIPADSDLADSLLNDQEDNLFLHGWGVANEPVYNQQATAYLLRDDAKAAIRVFYSYMASAFSHSVFEPVEHRWRWGQYYGPPSTDGAWFELYRNMLVRELDDRTLLLGQAAPRAWLADGKKIEVKNAPTWFGNVSFEVRSHADTGTIEAAVRLDGRQPPQAILLRLRHPESKPIRRVTINGRDWRDFDPAKEWVRLPAAGAQSYSVVAGY
jgi:hypothetical protein